MTVDEMVANALLTEFSQAQIYHDNVPENGTYPMICYTDLSESPALHADNKLYARSHVMRVTAITLGNHGINEIKQKIERCMVNAGFVWQSTDKVRDGKEYYTALDFEIGVRE